jgi:hypothetical protein
MLSTKPLASLSSGLLARKGQAKPAMRPQGFGGFAASPAAALDDLGWNDMGSSEQAAPAPVSYMPHAVEPVRPAPVPPVVALREALKAEVAKEPVAAPEPTPVAEPPKIAEPESEAQPRPISLATAARIGRDSAKQTKKGKAAFTLRLEAERHLKLRLASALSGRSAQLLVTEALDRMLAEMPEVDALIAQLPEAKRR